VSEVGCRKGAGILRVVTGDIVGGLREGAVDGSHIEEVSRIYQHACRVVVN